jgi:hypothetical protein
MGFPREKGEPEVAEERDGDSETRNDWEFPDHGYDSGEYGSSNTQRPSV